MQVFFPAILKETNARWLPIHSANVIAMLQNARLKNIEFCLLDLSFDEASQNKKTPSDILSDLILKKCSKIEKNQKIVIIFQLFNWNVAESILCVEKIKQKFAKFANEIIFVAMGENVSLRFECNKNAQNIEELEIFDFLIAGESETASLNLIKELLNLENEGKTAKNIIKNKIRFGLEENVENLPSAWLNKIIDPVTYNGAVLELSRKSYFTPAKNATPAFQNARYFSLARIEKELDLFAKKKVPDLFIMDENFIENKEKALQILRLFGKKLPNTHFFFNINAQNIDKQIANNFSNLACSLQIEFLNSAKIDKKAFAKKIAILNNFDLAFGFNFVYGNAGETWTNFKENVDFVLSLFPNSLEFERFSAVNGSKNFQTSQKVGLKIENKPPYFVQHTPTFSNLDLLKAEHLAFACDVFYSCGRAVAWFLAVLQPLRIKPSQFLMDFAEWQRCNNCAKNTNFNPHFVPHKEIERMQLSFLQFKYEEKHLSYAIPAMFDIVRLNGALARLWGEGEETILELSYNPEDILSEETKNILCFVEQTCIEECKIRLFISNDSPNFEYL